MIDNLLEIEVAYSMLKGGDAGEDPVDAHYQKLKTDIKVRSFVLLLCHPVCPANCTDDPC